MANIDERCVQLVNKAAAEYQKRNYYEVIALCDQALAIDPMLSAGYYNRGMARFMLGLHDLMLPDLERSLELDPTNAKIAHMLSFTYIRLTLYMKAIAAAQRAIEIQPDHEGAWLMMATAHVRIGNTETARKMFGHIAQKFPNNPVPKLEMAYLLPTIPQSREEMENNYNQFIKNLDDLIAQDFKLETPDTQCLNFPFYHAYYARNTITIAKKLSEFFLKACPKLTFTAPHCKKPRGKKDKIRIGFVSEFMHAITLNQFWFTMIEEMAKKDDFEVVIFSNSPITSPLVQEAANRVQKYVTMVGDVFNIREQVAKEEIDILVYLEIGMANQTYLLAHSRLAHAQCVFGGHPLTTGIATMDYFLSAKDLEPENAQEHYSEKLIEFERPIVTFSRRPQPKGIFSRETFGLPSKQQANIYCCPVMLFKIHPDMDDIFAEILKRDPKGIILLFDPLDQNLWRSSLQKRFASSMSPDIANRIYFMPHAKGDQFHEILRSVDAILDLVHFSFGTTAYITMGINLPFVTMAGEFLRGRTGYLMYHKMGINELIAKSKEDYVDIAVRLANDKAFYAEMVQKIREHSDVWFDDVGVVDLFADGLRKMIEDNAIAKVA